MVGNVAGRRPSNRNYPLLTTLSQFKSLPYKDAYRLNLCFSVSKAIAPHQPVQIRDSETHRRIHDVWWAWIETYNTEMQKTVDISAEFGVSLNEVGNFINDISIAVGMRRFFVNRAW